MRAEDLSLDGAARCAVPAGDSETDAPFYPDILYRHIFARRVAPDSALGAILEHPERHHLYNPVAPHLEQKSVLAELSRCSVEADAGRAAGLEEPIARLVRAHLPWTRMLSPGPGTGPDGRPVAELIHFAGESPATLVVKKSWDFGGKGVFLGAEHGDEASRQRMRERFGRELSWPELVRACADEGGWVAQERVLLPRQTLAVATADGIVERQVFVDVSAYTNLGIPEVAYGGVCRASLSPIVNIQSGGGVVPLISERAAAELVSRCGLGQGRPSAGGGTRGDA
ncbi:MAG: hypothetical protein HYV63_28435 [Candidatus Schekmanbacteria bacterium]|nr:hypothetical protein [Candidatus Schekmanbacteria bacterium]